MTQWDWSYYCPHFTDERTEAQRGHIKEWTLYLHLKDNQEMFTDMNQMEDQ